MNAKTKIISLNCHSLNNVIKANCLPFSALFKLLPDILCLQETHFRKQAILVLRSKWFSKQFLANGSSSSRGVAILFSKNINFTHRLKKK